MDTEARKNRRLRFSLRSLLYAIVMIALLLAFGRKVYDWYYAIPTIPLADAVASFNSRYRNDPVGQYESPVSVAEVVGSIRSQLPNLAASSKVKAIYSEIARTRQLLHDSSLYAMSAWGKKDGTYYTVWWINLNIQTGTDTGFGLRIRENNQPSAKPKEETTLKRHNLSWIPESPH